MPGSSHGPIRREDLLAARVDRWVLGHIHIPGGAGGEKYFYCGSPFPLRTTETGPHGCWLLDFQGGQFVGTTLVPCPVRVDTLDVALPDETPTETSISSRIGVGIQARVQAIRATHPGLATLYLKVRLTGRCDPAECLRQIEPGLQDLPAFDGVAVRILGAVENACTAPIPLAKWAERQDAPGRIAGVLRSLLAGEPDEEARRLLDELLQEERDSRGLKHYYAVPEGLRDPEVGGEAWARATLERACWRILDEIWLQEEAHG